MRTRHDALFERVACPQTLALMDAIGEGSNAHGIKGVRNSFSRNSCNNNLS